MSVPMFKEVHDPRSGWYSPAAGTQVLLIDGVAVLTVTSSGITTTIPITGDLGIVAVPNAAYAILTANSKKTHVVADVTADRTFTLPTPASGLEFEFIPGLNAADDFDWIFTTGADVNYFVGGVVHLDSDAGDLGDEVVPVLPDGNSNSKFQVNLPAPGTHLKFISDGTLWYLAGTVVSATAPTFADQA